MKYLLLAMLWGLLSCDTQHSEPTPWTLEPGAVTAPIPRRVFPMQPSTVSPYTLNELVYVFQVVDLFHVDEMPEPLSNLGISLERGPETVWLRLPPQVLGYEAVFECPHLKPAQTLYSQVEVSPGITVHCVADPSMILLYVSFINKRLGTWDYSQPSLDIGVDPDHMLYRWRFAHFKEENLEWFIYRYSAPWTKDENYGGFRL